MATVEKVLAQISERKKSIIEHVRHQIRLFDHHLSSNCLLAGVNPPPWLLPDAPAEFKKEDLISGLLFPRPQTSVPCSSSSHLGVYEQRVVRPDNLHFTDVLSREIHPLKEGFDVDIDSSAVQYPESGRFAPETGVATPADIKDPTSSGATVDPVLSFERVQRSRSRQKYLELRNSGKATKSNFGDARKVDACDPNSGGPQFVLQQSSHDAVGGSDMQKSGGNLSKFEGEDKVGKRSSQESFGNVLFGRVTRFRMDRQQSICAIEPTSGNNLSGHEGNGAVVLTGSLGRLGNADSCDSASFSRKVASSKSGQIDEFEQLKSAENLQVVKGPGFESCNTVCSGLFSGSDRQIKSVCEPTNVDNSSKLEKTDEVMSTSSLVGSRPVDYCDARTVVSRLPSLQTDEVDGSQILKSAWSMSASEGGNEEVRRLSNKRSVNLHSGRITSSRSPRCERNSNESPSMNYNCDIAKMDVAMSPGSHDNSRNEPSIAGQLFESEKNSGMRSKEIREMGETEEHRGTFQSNENRNGYACSKVTQSKSPSLQNANLNEDCKIGSHGSKQCCERESMLQPDKIYGSSEPVKFEVTKSAKTDCRLLENLVDQCVNEDSGSQSTLGDARSFKHSNPSHNSKHEVMQSKYNSSSKSPREILSKSYTGFGGQETSGAQENGLPYTSCSNILGPSIQDVIAMATDPDSNGFVKLHSGSLQSVQKAIDLPSKPKSSDRTSGFLLQDVGSSQQWKSAIVVKPKQLDFEDIGECHVGEASSLLLDKGKQGKIQFAEKCDETSRFQYPEDPNSIVKKTLSGDKVRSSEDLMIAASEKTCPTGRTSNINILPFEKKTSLTHPDDSFMGTQESSVISKPRMSLVGSSPEEKKTTKAVSAPDNAGVDFSNEDLGESDNLKFSKKTPGESSLNVNSGGFPEVSAESDFVRVDGPDLLEKVDLTQTECVIGSSTMIPIDGANINSGEQQKENLSSYAGGACSERCGQDEDNVILPSVEAAFHECHTVEEYLDSEKHSSYSLELSRSQKRRKINDFERVPSSSLGSKDKHSIQINGNESPVDVDQNSVCVADTPTSYPELQVDVGLYRREDKESCRNASFVFVSNVDKDTYEDFRTSLGGQQEVAGESIVASNSKQERKAEETQSFLQFTNKLEQQNIDQIMCNRETTGSQIDLMGGGEFPSDFSCEHSTELLNADLARPEMDLMVFEKETVESTVQSVGNCKLSTTGLPSRQSGLVDTDDVRPEMEGFVLQTNYEQFHLADRFSLHDFELPQTAVEHASLLKELSKPYVDTPLSQFMSNSKLQKPSSLFQSAPNGLLECLDTGLSFHANDYINNQLKLSTGWFGEDIRNAFHPRSFSDCCPGPSSQLPWEQKKPCASPVRKIWDTMSLNFSSSGKRSSLKKPELPCISEENETAEEVLDAPKREIDFDGLTCSSQRKPLAEVKEDLNVLPSVSEAETLNCRNSLDSVGTAYSFCATKGKAKQKAENLKTVKRRVQTKLKDNLNLQQGANKRASESLSRKLGNQKLSVKSSLTIGGPNSLAGEAKVNNIVSNIASFVPLVQKKPTAPVITGKKDVKVKALEAAEAAKRLAEKKQNERNMKKELAEQRRKRNENLKQLELQKKQKEEEQNRKEAQMAARKRQREEEERLEKERKRKRMEDAKKQQRELDEKMHAKKDGKEKNHQAPDERVDEKKAMRDAKDKKTVKDVRACNVEELAENKMRTSTASANATLSMVLDDHTSKAQSTGGDGMIEGQEILADTFHEQSYDISPYKGSDDEAEEEDDIEDTKFVPSWARKSCVALAVASQQNQDPEVIFPLGRSYSTSEVILPRRLQLR